MGEDLEGPSMVALEMGFEEEEVGIKDTSHRIWVCPVWGLHWHGLSLRDRTQCSPLVHLNVPRGSTKVQFCDVCMVGEAWWGTLGGVHETDRQVQSHSVRRKLSKGPRDLLQSSWGGEGAWVDAGESWSQAGHEFMPVKAEGPSPVQYILLSAFLHLWHFPWFKRCCKKFWFDGEDVHACRILIPVPCVCGREQG